MTKLLLEYKADPFDLYYGFYPGEHGIEPKSVHVYLNNKRRRMLFKLLLYRIPIRDLSIMILDYVFKRLQF